MRWLRTLEERGERFMYRIHWTLRPIVASAALIAFVIGGCLFASELVVPFCKGLSVKMCGAQPDVTAVNTTALAH